MVAQDPGPRAKVLASISDPLSGEGTFCCLKTGAFVGGEMLDGKASVAKDKPSIDKLYEDDCH